jgi:23S rRNA pseudouridine1911/1915/1917 synthase
MNRPLLDWLLQKFPDTPKTRAKQWIVAGRVSVNGVTIRHPNHLLPDPQDTLELQDRQATSLPCGPTGWPIHPRVQLLYLDGALAVVNKGAGLLAVSAEEKDLSAQSVLADYLAGKLRGRPVPAAYRRLQPMPVHRLDQYTTGVFCMAMNPGARQRMIAQVKEHSMRREYVAFVEGRPAKPQGTWRNWLRLGADGMTQTVVPPASIDACEAVTHYEVVAEYPSAGVAQLRLRLETGLKHQIRIQAAHAGLPLIGDRTYNFWYRGRFPRQALHAELLELEHPEHGKRMSWRAPLPADLLELEKLLR